MRNLIRCEMQSVLKSQVASETQTRINKGIDLFLDASIYFVQSLIFQVFITISLIKEEILLLAEI